MTEPQQPPPYPKNPSYPQPYSYDYPPPQHYLPPYWKPRRGISPTQVASGVLIGSAVFGVLGSFMPWSTAFGIGLAGISNWVGWVSILLSVVLGMLGALSLLPGTFRTVMFAFAFVCGVMIAGLASLVLFTFMRAVDGVFTSIGPGIFVVTIAGLVGVVGATIGVVMANKLQPPRAMAYPYPYYLPHQTD